MSTLQVEERENFTRRFGTVQRLGWGAMALVVLSAIGGLTGAGGAVPRAVQGFAEVPLVMRVGRPDHLTVYGSPAASLDPSLAEWLDVSDFAPALPRSERRILTVTARKAGLAYLRLPIGREEVAEFPVLVLP